MSVFVITSSYLNVDSGDCYTSVIGTYENFEKAQKVMEEEIRNARIDYKDCDYEEENYVKGDMSWSIWEKEYYMSNHYEISIHECEIE